MRWGSTSVETAAPRVHDFARITGLTVVIMVAWKMRGP